VLEGLVFALLYSDPWLRYRLPYAHFFSTEASGVSFTLCLELRGCGCCA